MSESEKAHATGPRARSRARRLAMQALYQWQFNDDSLTDLERQYKAEASTKVDLEYFSELLRQCRQEADNLNTAIEQYLDRPLDQLDPVERAILQIGLYELRYRIDVPYRVVINEGVELAKSFGGSEGHKYVNAVLDKAAAQLRSAEYQARSRGRA